MVELLQFLKALINPWLFIKNGDGKMTRKDFVLAVLAAGGCGVQYSPVQVQKLFFLIDREIPDLVEGRHFNFEPYNYGPFDKAVYDELETLEYGGYVERTSQQTWRNYRLTTDGQEQGDKILNSLDPGAQDYIETVAKRVFLGVSYAG